MRRYTKHLFLPLLLLGLWLLLNDCGLWLAAEGEMDFLSLAQSDGLSATSQPSP